MSTIRLDRHEPRQEPTASGGFIVLLPVKTAVCWCMLLFSTSHALCRQSRKSSRCQKLLDKLKAEQASAMATGRYPAASCPICFEDFDSPEDTAPSAPPFEPPAALKKEEGGKGGVGATAEEVGPSAPLLTRRRSSR